MVLVLECVLLRVRVVVRVRVLVRVLVYVLSSLSLVSFLRFPSSSYPRCSRTATTAAYGRARSAAAGSAAVGPFARKSFPRPGACLYATRAHTHAHTHDLSLASA